MLRIDNMSLIHMSTISITWPLDFNIAIMRTFTKLREFSKHYNSLAKQLIEIDRKYEKRQIKVNCFTFIASKPKRSEQKCSRVGEIYHLLKEALDALIAESEVADIKRIGFLKE